MALRGIPIRLTLLGVLSCLLLAGPAAGPAFASVCAGASASPAEASRVAISRTTLCLLNSERTSRGLHGLRLNPRLSVAARSHSGDMVSKHYFAHVSESGKDVVDRLYRTGYLGGAQRWIVGENLAWGSGERGTPAQIVKAWMRSPGHRQNILQRRFREIGIGVIDRTPDRAFPDGGTYTTAFGGREGLGAIRRPAPPKPLRLDAGKLRGPRQVGIDPAASPWSS